MSQVKKSTKIDIFASDKNKKPHKPLTGLQFAAVAVAALFLEGLAIDVANVVTNHFDNVNPNAGCDGSSPNPAGIICIGLLGLCVALFGIAKAFQQKSYLLRFSMIVLFLACIVLGLYALFIIVLAGSCFF